MLYTPITFEKAFMNNTESNEKTSDITEKKLVDVTIILNIWKRRHLNEQLQSIVDQTVIPKEIWVIHYEQHWQIQTILSSFENCLPSITLIESSKNLKYFGRFSLAINVVTEYIWILDDDVIPGRKWMENSCIKCDSLNSIISCTGRIIPKGDYQPENLENKSNNHFIGDLNYDDNINFYPIQKIVDFACQSYFFKYEWLKSFWSKWPATFLSGEDIHLSATCKYLLGIDTTVLKQIDHLTSGNLKKRYGYDSSATCKQNDFIMLREKVLKYHILENNWTPLRWRV